MSEPRWSDADPRPLYRDEQRPPARRQPLPREGDPRGHDPRGRYPRGGDSRGGDPRGRDPRGRDPRGRRSPDWQDPDSPGYGPGGRSGRGQRPPAREDGRPHWGALPAVLGVCIVIGGAALGALVSAVTSSPPGFVLSAFLVVGTICAVLAVRAKSVYRIIPVPALSYLVASLMTGLAVNQDGTTLTALAVGATQWVASGFVAMIISTVIATAATIIRWPRSSGRGGPRRPQAPGRNQGSRSVPPRGSNGQPRQFQDDQPRQPRDDRPRWPQEPRIRRTQDRDDDSLATAAFPDWRREGRNG